MSNSTGNEKEIDISSILKSKTIGVRDRLLTIGKIKIYVKVDFDVKYLSDIKISLIATITKSSNQQNSIEYINDINEFRKVSKYQNIMHSIRTIINKDLSLTEEISEEEQIIGFCLYDIENILIRNNELYVKVYLSRLWSYIKKGGIGIFLMNYGYELIKYYVNYDIENREKIFNILNQKDNYTNFYPVDKLGQSNLADLTTTKSGYYDEESVNKIKQNYSKSLELNIKFAYTLHDSSTKYSKNLLKKSSFYDFLIKQLDPTKCKGLIMSNKRYNTNDNSYRIEPMAYTATIEAYYAFDNNWKSKINPTIQLPSINIAYTNKNINKLSALYNYSESLYQRLRTKKMTQKSTKS